MKTNTIFFLCLLIIICSAKTTKAQVMLAPKDWISCGITVGVGAAVITMGAVQSNNDPALDPSGIYAIGAAIVLAGVISFIIRTNQSNEYKFDNGLQLSSLSNKHKVKRKLKFLHLTN